MVKSAGVIESRSSQSTGNDTGTPGRTPRAVRGDDRRSAGARRVDEDLAAAVLLHERGRRDLRIELLGAHRDRARRGGDVFDRRPAIDRDEHVDALGAARLDRALQADVVERLADERGRRERPSRSCRRPSGGSRSRTRWVHAVGTVGAHQPRVVLDGALVREPQQRAPVVAQRVGHLTLRRLRPDGDGSHPRRRVLGDVLLHERLLAAVHADHRKGPVGEDRDDPIRNTVEVLHEITLGRARAVEQWLVEVGERHAVARLAASVVAPVVGHFVAH